MGEFVVADETVPDVELFFDETYTNDQLAPRTPLVVRPHIFSAKSSVVRVLADTIDSRHRYWVGRTEFILPMAIGMDAVADNSVEILDLETAVCLHGFPMVRLSDESLYAKLLEVDQLYLLTSIQCWRTSWLLSWRIQICARASYISTLNDPTETAIQMAHVVTQIVEAQKY